MEPYLTLSFLNDFIFCPKSIYFHHLYGGTSTKLYHDEPQTKGLIAHAAIDQKKYSTSKTILQGLEIYSDRYGICGKIDTFNLKTGELVERKKKIKTIYPGYIYQLYAQYFCLEDMGYTVKSLKLHSLDDNKNYAVAIPGDDPALLARFEELLQNIRAFDLRAPFQANPNKCKHCIYNNLCDEVESC